MDTKYLLVIAFPFFVMTFVSLVLLLFNSFKLLNDAMALGVVKDRDPDLYQAIISNSKWNYFPLHQPMGYKFDFYWRLEISESFLKRLSNDHAQRIHQFDEIKVYLISRRKFKRWITVATICSTIAIVLATIGSA